MKKKKPLSFFGSKWGEGQGPNFQGDLLLSPVKLLSPFKYRDPDKQNGAKSNNIAIRLSLIFIVCSQC